MHLFISYNQHYCPEKRRIVHDLVLTLQKAC